jgi:hypothetical protein
MFSVTEHSSTFKKENIVMSTMAPEKLLNLWKREEISVEMAIGHILQNLVKLETAHDAYTIAVDNLQANVNDLIAHTGMEPRSKSKRARPKSG